MRISDLFFGPSGHVFALANSTIILVMMLLVSLRLFFSRRRRAYFSLTLSICIVIFQHLMLIAMNQHAGPNTQYWAQVLQTLAFILINMGIYQLYNASKRRDYAIFYISILISLLIMGLRFYAVHHAAEPTLRFIQLQNVWIELYLLLLVFLAFYMITPHVGQHIKYQFGLAVYFLVQISHFINIYVLQNDNPFFVSMENFLPIIYYITLFMIFFERVVELLQAVYASSIKDGLTGLYNRHYLLNRIQQYVRQKIGISVIFGDIDNFKKLNDTRGHQFADQVLKSVAKIMTEESEGIGMAGRYGGEELVIVLTDTSLRVENLAERVRERVEQETGSTISIGFSKYKRGVTAADLIAQADKAMYQSKKNGKNRISGYKPPESEPENRTI